MKKEKKIIVIMAIVSILVIAILSYFLINKNAIIEKQAKKIELQAMETNGSNSYTTTQEHLNETSKQTEPYIKKFDMGYYQNRSWSYKRITPVLTVNPNGCSSFTISQFGMLVNNPSYFSISSVTNGTFDGLTVYPIDKNVDVVVTFNTLAVTILDNNGSSGSCYIVSYE